MGLYISDASSVFVSTLIQGAAYYLVLRKLFADLLEGLWKFDGLCQHGHIYIFYEQIYPWIQEVFYRVELS